MNNLYAELQFLSGGGEMGALIRSKDWSNTAVGNPQSWPQSLRTTLSIILNSKFPMFLFWGPDLICFYNDAYRPSLGRNGKHPAMLGGRGEDFWVEIWSDIKPLIDHVLAGGDANWSEDQLLPIYRNGKMEEVYWTFSYSPVNDESGKPAGVFVTCTETTGKVLAHKQLEESKNRLQFAIDAADLATWDIDPATYRFTGNDRLKEWHGLPPGEEFNLEKGFNAVVEKDREGLKKAIEHALEFSSGGLLDHEYTIVNPLTGQSRIVRTQGKASFRENTAAYKLNGILQDVTEQVISRRQVEESKEQLNMAVEASELATAVIDLQTREIKHSKKFCKLLGYKEDCQLTETQLLERLHPEDTTIRQSALKQALMTGNLHYKARLRWSDSSIRWFESWGKVIYDDEHNPVKLISALKDITEETNYRKELEKSEQRFRLLADAMPQLVWIADPDGTVHFYNKRIEEFEGAKQLPDGSWKWESMVHEEDLQDTETTWLQSVEQRVTYVKEHRIKVRNGDYRWFLSRAYPQKDSTGNIIQWYGTATDIHVQKLFSIELEKQVLERTERLAFANQMLIENNKSLVDSEAFSRSITELSPTVIYMYDLENKKSIYLNPTGLKILGKELNAVNAIDNIQESIIHPEDIDSLTELMNQLKTSQPGEVFEHEFRIKDAHNNWVPFLGRDTAFKRNEKNEATELLGIAIDITELKNVQRILTEKNRELEKMNKELQSFAYISSHDLQEPLRKIQTFATRIINKEYQNLSEPGKDYFRRMQDAARRMQALIDDLLAYSRTNTSEIKFEKKDLNEIIREVKEDFMEEAAAKEAIIDADEMCEAYIIPFQFRQMMYNLISNSLKFSDPQRPPHILIKSKIVEGKILPEKKLSPREKYCHISIIDNGIGFEPEYSEKIFEVFQRLHGRENYRGTGIGLAIVKKIVDNHKGVITAKAEPNMGAIFDIYLPFISGTAAI
jgi:PAS domain S-box-containing protein